MKNYILISVHNGQIEVSGYDAKDVMDVLAMHGSDIEYNTSLSDEFEDRVIGVFELANPKNLIENMISEE